MMTGNAARGSNDLATTLRSRPVNPYAVGGFGPLIAGVVLVLVMVLLLPSIARERNVPDTAPTQPVATTTTQSAP